MYFLLPGILCQDDLFLFDGLIGEGVDLSSLCTTEVQVNGFFVAVDVTAVEIVGSQKIRGISLAREVAGYELVGDRPIASLLDARDLSALPAVAHKRNNIDGVVDLGLISPAQLLPGSPGYVGGFIGDAVDLSGIDVGQLPTDINGLLGIVELAADNSVIEAAGSQLVRQQNLFEVAILEVANQQFIMTVGMASGAHSYEVTGRKLETTVTTAQDLSDVSIAPHKKYRLEYAVDRAGLIDRGRLI